jgi:tetratricopeptide (TPR) repeat protein
LRLGGALVSYASYLGQFFYPVGLAAFYPHPAASLPVWKAVAALLLLAGISVAVIARVRRSPYLFVGWFWYLGMLVPVIGLMQVGVQAMADRYTYLPQIGLCMALAWGVVNVVGPWSNYRRLLSVFSMLVVAILIGCAWRQTGYWQDSKSLWTHALACTSNNAVADYNLGVALEKCGGATDEVIDHYRKAVKIMPDFPAAQNNLGVTLAKRGLFDEAIIHYKKALDIDPDYAQAQSNLAAALAKIGLFDEAMDHFREALRIKPDFAEAHCNLGKVLAKFGRIDEAVDHFQEALRIKPDYTGARQNLDALRSERAKKTTGTFWFFRKAECLIC